ncbi:class I SAM-dependent methyltransferase [Candidatus Uhrbacteria bacterium]|nr:class I SAM-dependent methyltransferase [Candidatus Uhrbacteria bacterium]
MADSNNAPQADPFIMSSWPHGGTERVLYCPVCSSENRHLLYTDLTDRIFYCAPGRWNLYECLKCGCGYLDPRPTQETIHLAYQRYYTHKIQTRVDGNLLVGLHRIFRALTNGYRNWRFGTEFRPASKIGIFVLWIVSGTRQKVDREFHHVPRPSPGAQLLDVGFGNGYFLNLAQAAGWKVSGCDTDPVTVASASKNGIDVRLGGIASFSNMPESFDMITLSHVIEHLHDPRDVSREIYRLLKPGGMVWMETPNIRSYGHLNFGRHWRGLEPPRHLVLFNWNALESMLEGCGFRDVKRLPLYDLYPSLAAKSNAIASGRDPYGKNLSKPRSRFMGFLLNVKTRLHPEKSEFITLIAHKPL